MAVFPRRKVNHDFLVDGGLEVTGNTTVAGNATITGTLTQTGVATFTAAPVLSAGIASLGAVTAQKAAVTMSTGGYMVEHVQSLTGAACARTGTTAGTPLVGYGVSKVALTIASASGAANYDLRLDPPSAIGVHKYIFLSHTGASTYETKVMPSATTTVLFWGTTANAIQLTTDWVSPVTSGFHLIGLSTQWAIVGSNLASTQWSICGATFGTT